MASKKFKEADEEYKIFAEYYSICEKYFIPEPKDSSEYEPYWKSLIKDTEAFVLKHKNHSFAVELVLALIRYLEDATEVL